MKIVFMGTPDYAVPTLQALLNDGQEITGVFCQPDKPVGRKQILTPPPVKQLALEHGLPVFQPTSLKNDEIVELIRSLQPDVMVVVAYGKILPKAVLDIPPLGCINGHGSLLPRYRGASPIQWALLNGEKETGVTAMYMDEGMDTGDILETVTTSIGPAETAEDLFNRLSVLTADLMIQTIHKADKGTLQPQKQQDDQATYAPIIRKEMACLDFRRPADELALAVRAYHGWPVAYTFIDGKRLKVYEALAEKANGTPGTVLESDQDLLVACGQSTALRLLTVQLEGGKQMTSSAMLKGHPVAVGTRLGEENTGG